MKTYLITGGAGFIGIRTLVRFAPRVSLSAIIARVIEYERGRA